MIECDEKECRYHKEGKCISPRDYCIHGGRLR